MKVNSLYARATFHAVHVEHVYVLPYSESFYNERLVSMRYRYMCAPRERKRPRQRSYGRWSLQRSRLWLCLVNNRPPASFIQLCAVESSIISKSLALPWTEKYHRLFAPRRCHRRRRINAGIIFTLLWRQRYELEMDSNRNPKALVITIESRYRTRNANTSARVSAAVSAEQFCVCTGYWILKNNGDERRKGGSRGGGWKMGYIRRSYLPTSRHWSFSKSLHCNAHRRAITASSSSQICRNKWRFRRLPG